MYKLKKHVLYSSCYLVVSELLGAYNSPLPDIYWSANKCCVKNNSFFGSKLHKAVEIVCLNVCMQLTLYSTAMILNLYSISRKGPQFDMHIRPQLSHHPLYKVNLTLTVYTLNQMDPYRSIWFHLYTVRVTDPYKGPIWPSGGPRTRCWEPVLCGRSCDMSLFLSYFVHSKILEGGGGYVGDSVKNNLLPARTISLLIY